MLMHEPLNGCVLRRRMNGAVIVGSSHDVLGLLLGEFCRGTDETAYYGLTTDVDQAHRFEPSEAYMDAFLSSILGSRVLRGSELERLRRLGRLVPAAAARDQTPRRLGRLVRWVNHCLEADAAWAEWRLSLRFGLADVKARRRALKHAGMTGWQIAGSERWEGHSYFENSAELRQAFESGRALCCAVSLKWNLRGRKNVSDGECAGASERLQASGGFQTRA